MSLQLIIVLSALGLSPVAAQHFPETVVSPSFTRPSWTWTWSPPSSSYAQPSWSAETPTWTPTVYTSETWSSVAPWPSTYTPSVSTPPWPEYSSSWAPVSYSSHSWSSETSPWSSWPTTIYSPHSWPSESPTWQSWPASKSWSSVAWPSPSPSLPSLNDALIAAGAAKFAALIASDPVVSAAYAAGVPTVFAPTDQYIGSGVNGTGLRKRATLTPAQQQQLLLHATQSQSEINGLRTPPGAVVPTKDTTANLKGSTQKVVSKPKNNTKTTSSKRWAPTILPRQDNTSSLDTLVDIYSGLGDSVGILTADIPFAGGLIHTTDGLFTLPVALSATAQTTGQTTFVSLASASNQSSVLDATPLITVFIPTNQAFAAANISPASSGIPSILAGHVVQDFAGYLPSFGNGASFVTQSGTTVTVTVQGDDYFVNNAKIIASNLILENGVAHVIDTVLTPPIAPYTGTSTSIQQVGVARSLVLALGVVVALALTS
ncbi:Fasciclin domain-containing protein isoform 2 [Cladophialophora immunda]|nr:Fasciclin domain-containing protein isoform 1 [Cladophialophora immunda]OQU98256.1 Fasciclin domain-containing protein isoform 2 [Cladophialophora immunda]